MSTSTSPELALAAGLGLGLGLGLALFARRRAVYKIPKVWKHEAGNGGKFASINAPTAGPRTGELHPASLERGEHALQLYSMGTPNGVKVTALLEELNLAYGLEYDAWLISIGGAQFGKGFVHANPNSKIPALLHYDPDAPADAPPTRVFESAAIMMYLCEQFDKDHLFMPPPGTKGRAECLSWLLWVQGSAPYVGGGFGHFYAYAPEPKIKYAVDRFSMETKRLLDVLNRHLGGLDGNKKATPYLCGDSLTIADLCAWPWFGNIVLGRLYGGSDTFLQVGEYTFVKAWADRVHARKGVQRGRCVNRPWGGAHEKLPNRHSASDFDSLPAPPEQKSE